MDLVRNCCKELVALCYLVTHAYGNSSTRQHRSNNWDNENKITQEFIYKAYALMKHPEDLTHMSKMVTVNMTSYEHTSFFFF